MDLTKPKPAGTGETIDDILNEDIESELDSVCISKQTGAHMLTHHLETKRYEYDTDFPRDFDNIIIVTTPNITQYFHS